MRVDDINLAHRLADAAGAAIRPYYRQPHGLESKGDSTPVTLADRAAEAAMRAILDAERPMEGIIGEEYGAERTEASCIWVLDPIDGTTSFVAGRPIFGTLIALCQDGWPMLGILDQPISGERWVGAVGQPSTFNGAPIRTRPCPDLAQAILATTGPHYFTEQEAERYLMLASQCARRRLIYGGDCYNYGLLAAGHIDLVAESGLKLYDYAALVPIVEGAGGRMCDWAGEPLTAESKGDVLACGDPARVEQVIEIFRSVDTTN
ncbi:MAG: histidinol-phosphatase [Alphaproteobacteria bacterium]|nr:histidinol-phosphatase [Alphaproteobacteria bacterium]MDE2340441.1 histidinol-phosphatase [Alphaproteobacteria bacterium]